MDWVKIVVSHSLGYFTNYCGQQGHEAIHFILFYIYSIQQIKSQ
jgi:hypothetical protein